MTNTRKVDVAITNPDGSIVFEKKGFEIPEAWSDRAAKIVASKYAMDNEYSAIGIIDRVVNQITDWGIEQGYFSNENDGDNEEVHSFFDKLKDILIDQRAAFNSPVWFNCGVKENSNQMSACFIFTVDDKMEDILDHVKREGIVFKSGSGAGINISKLRAKGEKLSNKGEASGPLSFMKVYDANAGSIKSGGKSRRSAKMVCLDVDHPDIMEFIECKKKEELKAKALIDAGYSQEEAYATVAFQNANHSIRVTDEFMMAVESEDSSWDLINRGDEKVAKRVMAKDILRRTAEIAWETGDPGIQFDSAMNMTNPIASSGRINSTNPCSEFSAIDNSSCNLASLNLIKYSNDDFSGFKFKQFGEDIEILITAMDIIVDAADYPTPEVRDITTRSRPLGLGFTNLGAMLMAYGIPYDSDRAREIASTITHFMTTRAYDKSIELAQKLGSFEMYEKNKHSVLYVARKILGDNSPVQAKIVKYGIRNSQLTLLAPTGTISFMMDCDSTGIEPLFALKAYKQLAGGGFLEIVPNCVEEAVDQISASGYDVGTDLYECIKNLPEDKKRIFDTANDISWKAHIDMMAACQKHINGAISKTVNMPADCTVDDVYDAYVYAWEKGIKAVAIYRDGSKGMQPLSTKKIEEKKEEHKDDVKWMAIRKRLPDDRPAKNHKFDIAGFEGYLTAGYYPDDGQLGEIFISGSKIGSQMKGLLESFAIVTSMALQYGVPLEALADKFINSKFDPAGITKNRDIVICSSIMDYVFKWLMSQFGTEIPEPEVKFDGNISFDGPSCNNCGGITTRQGTCFICPNCGETTGCS